MSEDSSSLCIVETSMLVDRLHSIGIDASSLCQNVIAKVVVEEKEKDTFVNSLSLKQKIEDCLLLPEGWQEYASEDGTPYYYNLISNETQWEKPSLICQPSKQRLFRVASLPAVARENPNSSVSKKEVTKFVRSKTPEDILEMLESGAVVNIDVRDTDNDDYTCLMHQSGWGSPETVECLLVQEPPAGINLQSREYSGGRRDSPLLLAVANNNVDILKVLLEYGADRHIPCGKHMLTCLEIARRHYRKHDECIQILESYFPECRSPTALKEKEIRLESERQEWLRLEDEQRAKDEAKRAEIEKRRAEMRAMEDKLAEDQRRAQERAEERRMEKERTEAEMAAKELADRLEREKQEELKAERARLEWEQKEFERRERNRPFYCCLRLKKIYCG